MPETRDGGHGLLECEQNRAECNLQKLDNDAHKSVPFTKVKVNLSKRSLPNVLVMEHLQSESEPVGEGMRC